MKFPTLPCFESAAQADIKGQNQDQARIQADRGAGTAQPGVRSLPFRFPYRILGTLRCLAGRRRLAIFCIIDVYTVGLKQEIYTIRSIIISFSRL